MREGILLSLIPEIAFLDGHPAVVLQHLGTSPKSLIVHLND